MVPWCGFFLCFELLAVKKKRNCAENLFDSKFVKIFDVLVIMPACKNIVKGYDLASFTAML